MLFSIEKLSIQKQQKYLKISPKEMSGERLRKIAEELEEELKKRMRGK